MIYRKSTESLVGRILPCRVDSGANHPGLFHVKSTNIWEIKKVHVSKINHILTIHSPGTQVLGTCFPKKLSNPMKMVAVMLHRINGGPPILQTKQSHENGGCNASSYKWGTTNIAIFLQFHIFIHSSIF